MTEDSASTDTGVHDDGLDEFRALVRGAFEQAQTSGKPGWEEMTTAVLKNRLLSITQREFTESRYGSPSFIHLVRRIPDLVDVVGDQPPFKVRIRAPAIVTVADTDSVSAAESATVSIGERGISSLPEGDWRKARIRDDLWRAIVDYSSGNSYVLDANTGHARRKEASDEGLPALPTASREEFFSWRQEFYDSVAPSLIGRSADDFTEWLNHDGPQKDLPPPLRGRWLEFLKRKVSNRIRDWFLSQGKAPPNDMLLIRETGGLSSAEAIDEVVRTRQLRELIIRAVRTMTYEELSKISLPAFALLRASGRDVRQPKQYD